MTEIVLKTDVNGTEACAIRLVLRDRKNFSIFEIDNNMLKVKMLLIERIDFGGERCPCLVEKPSWTRNSSLMKKKDFLIIDGLIDRAVAEALDCGCIHYDFCRSAAWKKHAMNNASSCMQAVVCLDCRLFNHPQSRETVLIEAESNYEYMLEKMFYSDE